MRMTSSRDVVKPPRPYLPPMTGMAAGALLSSVAVMEAGWSDWIHEGSGAIARSPSCVAAFVGLGACVVFVSACIRRWCFGAEALTRFSTYLVCLGAGLAVGALAGWSGIEQRSQGVQALLGNPVSAYAFVVQGDPANTTFGASMTAEVYLDGQNTGAVVELTGDTTFEAGTELSLVGRFTPLDANAWGKRDYMAGTVCGVTMVRVRCSIDRPGPIDALRSRILAGIDPDTSDAHALIAGIVCGRTTEQRGSASSEAFSRTGTTHLIAVSGSHLTLVSALVMMVLERLGCGRHITTAVVAVGMGWYVLFTGAAPSAVRSFTMVLVAMVSTLSGRRGHGLSGLMVAIVVLVALDSGVAYDLGFQLSAASVLFILTFASYLTYVLQRLRLPQTLAAALALTLVAQAATLPLTLPLFGELSLVAPLANLVLGPVMSALLTVGLPAVLLVALAPQLLGWLLVLPLALARLSLFLVAILASIPGASIAVDIDGMVVFAPYVCAAALYLGWWDASLPVLASGCALVAVTVVASTVRWTYMAPAQAIVLDVGQGDAIVLREGAACIMVDAGIDEATAAALSRNHVSHLDAVVITHWDRDHWGGLPAVAAGVAIDRLVVAEGACDAIPAEVEELDIPVVELSLGDGLYVGGFFCEMVLPDEPVVGEENEDSLVLDVGYTGGDAALTMLLTGDAEAPVLEDVAGEIGHIDVLKMGHHGSKESVSKELLDALDPAVAVASAGKDNAYGHPAPESMALVEEAGAVAICTAEVGDVYITPRAGGYDVESIRRGRVE